MPTNLAGGAVNPTALQDRLILSLRGWARLFAFLWLKNLRSSMCLKQQQGAREVQTLVYAIRILKRRHRRHCTEYGR